MRAAMRFNMFDPVGSKSLWREAARSALAVGDAELASWHLAWYLQARDTAEPALRASDDQLREELARLVSEGN